MSSANFPFDPETFEISTDVAKKAAAPYAEGYQAAEPYNHTCIDNFLPVEIIENVRKDIESLPKAEEGFSRAQENLKTSYNPDRLPSYTRNLFRAFNSRQFIMFLEELTGIPALIPDPYFMGAGIHRTETGGHLDIHADFNLHKVMNVERRLNVLIYLNPDWHEDWGGAFEVWNKEMTKKEASFLPNYNRMVCFSTGSDTFHGNPEPVNHPENQPRLSIALYYYTATWDDTRKSHTTLFKPRPGSTDKADKKVARQQFVQDILPPFIYRKIARSHRKKT